MIDDGTLLRQFVKDRSQTAFAELVRRYLNLVYSVAVRSLRGDAHRAHDVSQQVFAALARKAPALCHRSSVAGWLHRSAQLAAAEWVRSEVRRRNREEAGAVLHAPETDAPWEELRPALDDVIEELKPDDREAILLRFFGQQSFAEIGALLQSSEDVAQKRVSRALTKLRSKLAIRGITSSTAALATMLEAHAVVTAPAALAPAILTSASAAVLGSTVAIPLFTMNMIKMSAGAVLAAAGVGGLSWQYQTNRHLENATKELARQVEQLPALRTENERLRAAGKKSEAEIVRMQVELARTNQQVRPSAVIGSRGPSAKEAEDKPVSRRGTPSAASQLIRAAIEGGDSDTLRPALAFSPKSQVLAHDAFYKLSPEQRARYGSPEGMMAELLCATTIKPLTTQVLLTEEVPGAQGMDPEMASDPRYKSIHTRTQDASGRVRDGYQVFQQSPDGWRWVVADGLVLKRLVEAGLMAVPAPQPPTK